MLVGPSRLGKTVWARSLGTHVYLNGRWCIDAVREGARYIVFDDIPYGHIPKGFVGGQRSFTLTGKYRVPRVIQWGRPCIILCNGDNDPLNDLHYGTPEREWFDANTIYVKVEKAMFMDP